jgi:hypothetical protein
MRVISVFDTLESRWYERFMTGLSVYFDIHQKNCKIENQRS